MADGRVTPIDPTSLLTQEPTGGTPHHDDSDDDNDGDADADSDGDDDDSNGNDDDDDDDNLRHDDLSSYTRDH